MKIHDETKKSWITQQNLGLHREILDYTEKSRMKSEKPEINLMRPLASLNGSEVCKLSELSSELVFLKGKYLQIQWNTINNL